MDLTISQVSEKLGMSQSMLRRYEPMGLVPPCRRRGKWRVWREDDIARYLAERDGQGSHPTEAPPAQSAEPARSECPLPSQPSSDRPEN